MEKVKKCRSAIEYGKSQLGREFNFFNFLKNIFKDVGLDLGKAVK